jgi:hypothetical protein
MNKFPSPTYLMGSLLEDGVDIDLALRLAHGYADARSAMSDEQTQLWLSAMLTRLGGMHRHSTTLAVLAYPSDHDTARYEQLAREHGWKENDDAHTPEQI